MSNQSLQQNILEDSQDTIFKNENQIHISSVKKNKKIVFNHIVSAVLIPCIKDMDTEMRAQLWWNNVDYMNFYIASKAEIDFFLSVNNDLNRKDAIRLLYQHCMICYEPYMM